MATKILIVDDDRLNTTLISFSLRERGYDVTLAENGKVGLMCVSKNPPDLIVLDVQMPEMNGFEFMNEIKTIPGGALIPVIMLTANETMQDTFFAVFVKGYFVKPVNPPDLEAKIRKTLNITEP